MRYTIEKIDHSNTHTSVPNERWWKIKDQESGEFLLAEYKTKEAAQEIADRKNK